MLARCSRVLYDNRILDLTQKLHKLENRDKVLRVRFSSKGEWNKAVADFNKSVHMFITQCAAFGHILGHFPCAAGIVDCVKFLELSRLGEHYSAQLDKLTKGKSPKWCQRKAAELVRNLQVGLAGLRNVLQAGNGTYPFMNWRPVEFAYFFCGMVRAYETSYESHKYPHCQGWLDAIPYYHCCLCIERIDTVYLYRGMYKYLFEQRCVRCIKAILEKVKSIQGLWRGYRTRTLLGLLESKG